MRLKARLACLLPEARRPVIMAWWQRGGNWQSSGSGRWQPEWQWSWAKGAWQGAWHGGCGVSQPASEHGVSQPASGGGASASGGKGGWGCPKASRSRGTPARVGNAIPVFAQERPSRELVGRLEKTSQPSRLACEHTCDARLVLGRGNTARYRCAKIVCVCGVGLPTTHGLPQKRTISTWI